MTHHRSAQSSPRDAADRPRLVSGQAPKPKGKGAKAERLRAGGYVRNATTEHGNSPLRAQVEAVTGFANANGMVIEEIYADSNCSGMTLAQRPGLSKMMEDAAAGRIDVVIVPDCDRLGRSNVAVAVLEEMRRIEVPVIDVVAGRRLDLPGAFLATSGKKVEKNPRRRPFGTRGAL